MFWFYIVKVPAGAYHYLSPNLFATGFAFMLFIEKYQMWSTIFVQTSITTEIFEGYFIHSVVENFIALLDFTNFHEKLGSMIERLT